MISVSWYSLFSAIAVYSIALTAVYVLRKHMIFSKNYGISILLFATALAVLRLILPLDVPFSHIFTSWKIIPVIQQFFISNDWALLLVWAVWSIGAAVVLIRDIYFLIRAYTISKNYTIVSNSHVDEIAESLFVGYPVLVSPDVGIPYVAGLFKHTIYIPDWELSDLEIKLILQHETKHIQSRDSQIKLFWGLLSAVLWWDPIVYKFRGEIDALLEFRCDAKVTALMDAGSRVQYLEMLLKIAKQNTVFPKQSVLSLNESAALNSPYVLEQRFKIISGNLSNKVPQRTSLIVKCALIALFLSSYLIIWQPASTALIEEVEGSIQLKGIQGDFITTDEVAQEIETACIVKLDGRYYLVVDGKQDVEISFDELHSDTYKNYIILEEYVP